MDEKNKLYEKFIRIVIIIATSTVVLGVIVPFLLSLYLPVLFPKLDITSLKSFGVEAGAVLSFISTCLAVYSIQLSLKSNKDFKDMFDMIKKINQNQSEFIKGLSNSTNQERSFSIKYEDISWFTDTSR